MTNADEIRRRIQEQRERETRESVRESQREERERFAKESSDAERVFRDLENKLDQESGDE
jgi:hypothetical protein